MFKGTDMRTATRHADDDRSLMELRVYLRTVPPLAGPQMADARTIRVLKRIGAIITPNPIPS